MGYVKRNQNESIEDFYERAKNSFPCICKSYGYNSRCNEGFGFDEFRVLDDIRWANIKKASMNEYGCYVPLAGFTYDDCFQFGVDLMDYHNLDSVKLMINGVIVSINKGSSRDEIIDTMLIK